MTQVYITIDTEYSAALFRRLGAAGRQENFDRSIWGKTPGGDVGIGHQMDMFDRYGMKAVFFVDPMPALIWGTGAISDIVQPILARGHDVQLHCHTEWLEFAGDAGPACGRNGRNIKDFSAADQLAILAYAADILVAAGAPRPVAFRAGNYGANDDTLRALAKLGIAYDTSHCPGIAAGDCAIALPGSQHAPTVYCGVTEIPIGAICAAGGGMRHAQITALSAREMIAAVGFARASGAGCFTLVSHSFELMSRDRTRGNAILLRRFEKFCRLFANMPGVSTATYRDSPPKLDETPPQAACLPHSYLRTAERMIEQAIGNRIYGAK